MACGESILYLTVCYTRTSKLAKAEVLGCNSIYLVSTATLGIIHISNRFQTKLPISDKKIYNLQVTRFSG